MPLTCKMLTYLVGSGDCCIFSSVVLSLKKQTTPYVFQDTHLKPLLKCTLYLEFF